MPTQQTILEMVFADSESDSDDEIVEKNPPKQVLEEPPKKRRKRLDLVRLGSVLSGRPGIIEETHCKLSEGVESII